MTRRGLYSSDFSDEARERLGDAVETTRRALGFETRKQFKVASGIGVRSIEKIELGEKGVGPRIFDRLQRALPGWTTETIRQILDGGPVPPLPAKPRAQLDIQWHTKDAISELLVSNPDAAAVLEELARMRHDFRKAGLTGDHLLAVAEDALRGR